MKGELEPHESAEKEGEISRITWGNKLKLKLLALFSGSPLLTTIPPVQAKNGRRTEVFTFRPRREKGEVDLALGKFLNNRSNYNKMLKYVFGYLKLHWPKNGKYTYEEFKKIAEKSSRFPEWGKVGGALRVISEIHEDGKGRDMSLNRVLCKIIEYIIPKDKEFAARLEKEMGKLQCNRFET